MRWSVWLYAWEESRVGFASRRHEGAYCEDIWSLLEWMATVVRAGTEVSAVDTDLAKPVMMVTRRRGKRRGDGEVEWGKRRMNADERQSKPVLYCNVHAE